MHAGYSLSLSVPGEISACTLQVPELQDALSTFGKSMANLRGGKLAQLTPVPWTVPRAIDAPKFAPNGCDFATWVADALPASSHALVNPPDATRPASKAAVALPESDYSLVAYFEGVPACRQCILTCASLSLLCMTFHEDRAM